MFPPAAYGFHWTNLSTWADPSNKKNNKSPAMC